ncbi:MAG: MBL fold metallo-hydrolase [bacterium]
MRIHHLTVGYFRPPLRGLTQGGEGRWLGRSKYVIHCLLLELEDRLVLVDSGLGRDDMNSPTLSLGWGMAWFGGASPGETAARQISALHASNAIRPSLRVTDVILTHLDKDHTGGLCDFPQARVHVHSLEHAAWKRPKGPALGQRYSGRHLAHKPLWENYAADEFSDDWFGFRAARLRDLPGTLRMIHLPGHTLGHCGLAIYTSQGWLLHAGDCVYHSAWLQGSQPPPAIRLTERMLAQDWRAWNATREQVTALRESGNAVVFTSHDPEMFRKLKNS